MQFLSLLLLTLTTTTLALPGLTTRQQAVDSELSTTPNRAAKPKPSGAASPSDTPKPGSGNSTSSCSPEVMALAAGIQSNIDDQNNELATVNAMGSVLTQDPVDTTLYGATQASLMGYVTKGIAIREKNQKLAPAGNKAVAGLATVADAQAQELNLTMSLALPSSGAVDTATAKKTVETLKKDFSGGIEQNKKNMAAAMDGCTPPKSSKSSKGGKN